ncbi:MAG: head-tail connector protein [Rhodospirillales bacterium]|nr:head-tail connector protein [Rhodospirillales bacterium]
MTLETNMNELATQKATLDRYARAQQRRSAWTGFWDECYEFALPQFGGSASPHRAAATKIDRLFDGTAPDAVDQLAATLLAHVTPPSSRWFALDVGPDVDAAHGQITAAELERSTRLLHSHFERSNFAVEIHQCFLDLVTAGTASLLFEEAAAGNPSAFRLAAVPLAQIALEEGEDGRLDATFRKTQLSLSQVLARFPNAQCIDDIRKLALNDPNASIGVLEAVTPEDGGYSYLAFAETSVCPASGMRILANGHFRASPFINFRWSKAPGEIYGRSPVMKALPDIKTANKAVELVLKNASIAVTGIWQADDDGVLNPATIKLVPGTIIPKAVGSAGLKPLEAPGRFDVSEIVLDQVRSRIRKALLVDQLGFVNGPRMTATEVLERSAEMARVLGATYGRLQSEFLVPLLRRAIAILTRRGEIADIPVDGRIATINFTSPHARHQAQHDAHNTMLWLSAVREMGSEAFAIVDQVAAAKWLGRAFSVPGELIRDNDLMSGRAAEASRQIDASVLGPDEVVDPQAEALDLPLSGES